MKDYDYSRMFDDQIKSILKYCSKKLIKIEISTKEQDMKFARDYTISVREGSICARVRRGKTFLKTYKDITIRALCNGNFTELHKLKAGYGDWYLYCWEDDNIINNWILFDLNIFRESGLINNQADCKVNKDGFTGFYSYDIESLFKYDCVTSYYFDDDISINTECQLVLAI